MGDVLGEEDGGGLGVGEGQDLAGGLGPIWPAAAWPAAGRQISGMGVGFGLGVFVEKKRTTKKTAAGFHGEKKRGRS